MVSKDLPAKSAGTPTRESTSWRSTHWINIPAGIARVKGDNRRILSTSRTRLIISKAFATVVREARLFASIAASPLASWVTWTYTWNGSTSMLTDRCCWLSPSRLLIVVVGRGVCTHVPSAAISIQEPTCCGDISSVNTTFLFHSKIPKRRLKLRSNTTFVKSVARLFNGSIGCVNICLRLIEWRWNKFSCNPILCVITSVKSYLSYGQVLC